MLDMTDDVERLVEGKLNVLTTLRALWQSRSAFEEQSLFAGVAHP
jgi:hypothetical protein